MNNYVFLSSWIFLGWHKKIFIIDLYRTFLNLRFSVSLFTACAKRKRPVIFVCIRSVFGPMVARYGFVCGEVFNIYWWIFGTLTNFRRILGWNHLLVKLMMRNRYKLRYRDKKRLASYFGLALHKRRIPAAGFVPSVLDNIGPVDEFLAGRIPCVGIIDSNVPSWNVILPVPGNDDSSICVNFYCYLFARSLLAGKVKFVFHWKFLKQLEEEEEEDSYGPVDNRHVTNFIYMYSNIYKYYEKQKFFDVFNNIRKAQIPLSSSVSSFINFWLQDSGIVEEFSAYDKEFYLSREEYILSEYVGMHFELS